MEVHKRLLLAAGHNYIDRGSNLGLLYDICPLYDLHAVGNS